MIAKFLRQVYRELNKEHTPNEADSDSFLYQIYRDNLNSIEGDPVKKDSTHIYYEIKGQNRTVKYTRNYKNEIDDVEIIFEKVTVDEFVSIIPKELKGLCSQNKWGEPYPLEIYIGD